MAASRDHSMVVYCSVQICHKVGIRGSINLSSFDLHAVDVDGISRREPLMSNGTAQPNVN